MGQSWGASWVGWDLVGVAWGGCSHGGCGVCAQRRLGGALGGEVCCRKVLECMCTSGVYWWGWGLGKGCLAATLPLKTLVVFGFAPMMGAVAVL